MKQPIRILKLSKKALHHFTCWSVLFWQINPVMGQNPEDELLESIGSGSGNSGTTVGAGSSTGNSNGSSSGGVTKILGKEIDPKSKMLIGNIALFAAAISAPTLVKHCPRISTYIYAGASALYVANEIGLFTSFQTATDLEMAAYLGRGDEESQIDSLQTAASQTRKAVKAAKTRSLVSKIAAAGYGAASAMAIYESFNKATSTCVQLAAEPTVDIKKQEFNYMSNKTDLKFSFLKDNSIHSDIDTFFNFQEQIAFSEGALSSPSINDYYQAQKDFGNKNEFKIKEKLLKYAQLISSLVIESAHAGDGKSGGINWAGSTAKLGVLGLGVAGAYVVRTSSKAIITSKFVNSPYGRAAGFAGFALFAYGASTESGKAANNLEARATEYDNLANQLRIRVNQNIATGSTSGQLAAQSVQGIESGVTAKNDNNDICFTGGPATVSPDAKCDCAKTQTCKQPEIPNIDNIGEFNGKSLIVDSLNDFSNVGKDLYNGRLQTGTTKGQSLLNNAARITRLRDSMLDQINKNRDKNGKKEIDMAALEKQFENGLLNQVNKAFSGLSESEKNSLARFAPGFGTDLNANKDSSKEAVADTSKSTPQQIAKGDVNPNAGATKASDANQGANWKFDFDDDEPTEEEKAAIAAALAQEDENYIVEGDISEDRNKNLFNIITRRYLKSAYPVIFEEDR